MKPESSSTSPFSGALSRRVVTACFILTFVAFCCFVVVLYGGADTVGFLKTGTARRYPNLLASVSLGDSGRRRDREENRLEKVLKDASMPDQTVILTTLNEAWASPNSIVDLFQESFRIGEQTPRLLRHLVIVALDQKAFDRCLEIHAHCFALITEEEKAAKSSGEAYFMTPAYLKMMWSRINFLGSVLELGYNFVFTDADIMWFRDPFSHFYSDADFQIACDHYTGKPDDVRNRPNGGFKFVRSNNRTIEFYKYWYASQRRYPGLHDQDVLNRIKNDALIRDIGLKMRFLSTANFGGFCEPSKDLNKVCTMHANCCYGLHNKLHDLRILLKDWKSFRALSPKHKGLSRVSWRVPQNCRLSARRN